MSNPLINRWGSNLMWYHFWYSDTTYGKQLQQDRIFSKLLETYLTYGLETHHNHFMSLYWYKRLKQSIPILTYYRQMTMTRSQIGVVTTFKLRKSMIDFYRMRIWILRYSNWLIINMYWFHPNKNRKVTQKLIQNSTEYDYVNTNNVFKPTTCRRLLSIHSLTNLYTLNDASKHSHYIF